MTSIAAGRTTSPQGTIDNGAHPRAESGRRAVVLTALSVEYKAVRGLLTGLYEEVHAQGTIYERGSFLDGGSSWDMLIAEIGAGNADAAVQAERAIRHFSPEVILLVGVAGGVRDVGLGDVVVATKVYGYESGKVRMTFDARPAVGQSSYRLEQRAKAEARRDDWRARLEERATHPPPRVVVAPIAAGEKVLREARSEVCRFLRTHFDDTVAVEMEGHGFLRAVHANDRVEALIVRGISNLLDGAAATDEINWRERASHHAAVFALAVLARFGAESRSSAQPPSPPSARTTLSGRSSEAPHARESVQRVRRRSDAAETPRTLSACRACQRTFSNGGASACPHDGTKLEPIDTVAVPPYPDDPLVGATIADRYEIRRIVVDGSMGRVYEARTLPDQERVALKVIHAQVAEEPANWERFRREAETSSSLDHSHIVRVIEFRGLRSLPGRRGKMAWYLAMEYLDGEDLRDLLHREKTVRVAKVIRIASQVAVALDSAHDRGYVHRDIKPDNVFLADEKGDLRAKVLDFGLVKITKGPDKYVKLTVMGTTIGSPFYMSPEQCQNSPDVDHRADVWAMAVVIYEMLVGRVPFLASNGPQIQFRILTEDPVPPSVANAEAPAELDPVLLKGLQKDPGDRFQSCGELADALGHALGLPGSHKEWAVPSEREVARFFGEEPPPAPPAESTPASSGGALSSRPSQAAAEARMSEGSRETAPQSAPEIDPKPPVSEVKPWQVVLRGHMVVTLPVALLVVAPYALGRGFVLGRSGSAVLGLIGLVFGWFWWAFTLPRWRDWVEDKGLRPEDVQRLAAWTGLLWPRGSWPERTEFRRRDGRRGW